MLPSKKTESTRAGTPDNMTERELAADAPWKLIQKNCFTRWTNEHLKTVNMHIADLETDFSDGLRLIALVKVLSGKPFEHRFSRRPTIRTQKLENVTMALKFLERDEGIRLVNIDSSNIVDSNLKLILGLIWTLILHYSISLPVWEDDDMLLGPSGKKEQTPKQRLLAWIQNKVPDRAITNFTTDWNDGRAIGALVDGIAPGLCPNWEDWVPEDRVRNATEAMEAAEKWLDVPQLVKPDEMCHTKVDELSMMTYLSQFPNAKLKAGAPLRPRTNANKVRAYGAGLEPTGNNVGGPASFIVETFGAGRGDLEVVVTNPDGVVEPHTCVDNQDKKLTFTCTYTPTMEGQYTVNIKFAGREIPKSPFHAGVKGMAGDASKVTVSGPGIEPSGLTAKQKTHFEVHTKNAGLGVVEIFVERPSSRDRVRSVVTQQSEELWLAEYVPSEPGEHHVSVMFAGKPVPGSPFITEVKPVVDAKKCVVSGRGIQPHGIRVGDLAVFRVSTAGAGDADLTVDVKRTTGGEETVEIVQIKPTLYECRYKPSKFGNCKIAVNYGGLPVPNSPFAVEIGAVSKCRLKAFGPGLSGGVVGFPACFAIETNGEKGALSFSIAGPTHAEIECHDNNDGSANAAYYPTAPGEYVVRIMFDNVDINGSPFIAQIVPAPDGFDPSQVQTDGAGLEPHGVIVNEPATFTVDTKRAGKAELNVVVLDADYNPLEVDIKSDGNGKYTCVYTPTRNIQHSVVISYGGVNIANSPYRVYVQEPSDPSKVRVYGPAIDDKPLTFQNTSFTVDCTNAGPGDVAVSLFDAKGRDVAIETIDNKNNTFEVAFQPHAVGTITAKVFFADVEIPSSPYLITVSPHVNVDGLRVHGIEKNAFVDCELEFVVDGQSIRNFDSQKLKAIVTAPSGEKLGAAVESGADGTCKCYYTPLTEGAYQVDVKYDGLPLKSSPFSFNAVSGCDITKVKAFGPGLSDGLTNREQTFTVETQGAGQGSLSVLIDGPVATDASSAVNKVGQCQITYLPTVRGPYHINITYANQHISGSPFKVVMKDEVSANKVRWSLEHNAVRKGHPILFTVDTSDAGEAILEATVTAPNGNVYDADVVPIVTGTYHVEFTPDDEGIWKFNVKYGKESLPQSPFAVTVLPAYDASKVKVTGEGISPSSVEAGRPTSFVVDTTDAGNAELTVDILDSDGNSIVPSVQSDGKGLNRVKYTANLSGKSVIDVKYGGRDVMASPFHVNVSPVGDATSVAIVDGGVGVIPVGELTTITLDTSEAGRGHVTCYVTGNDGKPVKVDVCEGINGTVDIKYTPSTAQDYTVKIYYGGQLIPDGEFIQKALEADEYEAYLKETQITSTAAQGTESMMVNGFHDVVDSGDMAVDTSKVVYRAADFCIPVGPIFNFITAEVVTPSGDKHRPKLIDCRNGFVSIKYEPVETGLHHLHVIYNDLPVVGSPFEFFVDPIKMGHVSAYGPGLSHGVATTQCRFTVNSSDCGPGGLAVAVEGPSKAEIQCTDNDEDSTCNVAYYPQAPGEYSISVKFAGQHIHGSPFTAKIVPAGVDQNQKTSLASVPVDGGVKSLDVFDSDVDSLKATIISPSGLQYPECTLTKLSSGHLGIKFVPLQSGTHSVNIYRNNKPITGSPFDVSVAEWEIANVDRVKVYGHGLTEGHTDKPCQFYIDTSDAGCGGISLSIEGASKADIECTDCGNGTCCVTYHPTAPGIYVINVLFAEQPVPGSPYLVKIEGDALGTELNVAERKRTAADVSHVGSECELSLKLPGTQLSDIRAIVTSPSGVSDECDIVPETAGLYRVIFIPRETGLHNISVYHYDKHIPGSPFEFTVGPIKNGGAHKVLAVGQGLEMASVDTPGHFTLYTREAGLGRLSVAMEGPSKSDIHIEDLKDGVCEVSYICTEKGDYLLAIKFDDVHIPNSPFKVHVIPSGSDTENWISSKFESVVSEINKPAFYELSAITDRSQLDAYVLAPSGAEHDAIIQEIDRGRYAVRFVPRENGVHWIHARQNKIEVSGSPFKLIVGSLEANAALVHAHGQGLISGQTGEECKFIVDTEKAGDGALAVTVDGPSKVQLDCSEIQAGYEFTYTPTAPGIYSVSIKYAGDAHIPGSPFQVIVKGQTVSIETITRTVTQTQVVKDSTTCDASRVTSQGSGLGRAVINTETTFTVDTSAAGRGMLLVGVLGPSGPCEEIVVRHIGHGCYGVTYKPSESGHYTIVVKWGNEHIPGSPFHFRVH